MLFSKWPPHAVTASELCNLQLSNRARAFTLAIAALFFPLLFSHFICSIFACEIEQNEGVKKRYIEYLDTPGKQKILEET